MSSVRQDVRIEIQAPAKVNLFLEVHGRRADGFHELETLIVPLELCDTVCFRPRSERGLRVHCEWTAGRRARRRPEIWEPLPRGETNLVYRALRDFRQATGARGGAEVAISKRIPAAAGLGGASSDAAAALLAANASWKTGWTPAELTAWSARVGSDVPFFLSPTAAICRGRGESVQPLDVHGKLWMVIVRPPAGLATAEIYRHCRPASSPQQRVSVEAMRQALRRGDPHAVARHLFNRLQTAAECQSPWIARLREAFQRTDCLGHQMTGSGSCYFGICRHRSHARRVAEKLSAAKLGAVFVTATLGTRMAPAANHFMEEHHANHRGSHQADGEDR